MNRPVFDHLYTPKALLIRDVLAKGGFKTWIVGGAVRDAVRGKTDCADIDFSTDATPEEGIALFTDAGYVALPIGISHGTFRVWIDGEVFEITRLHNGHLVEDLGRRDLTMNAMAIDFGGILFDPYGGFADMREGRVRFVGNMEDRIKEDPLRMLRFIRFSYLEGMEKQYTSDWTKWDGWRFKEFLPLLKNVSGERIWIELEKVLRHPKGTEIFNWYSHTGLDDAIGMPDYSLYSFIKNKTNDPVALMAITADTDRLAKFWGWSGKDRARARLIREHYTRALAVSRDPLSVEALKVRIAAHSEPLDWVVMALRLADRDNDAEQLLNWKRPAFPLRGQDLENVDDETLAVLKCEWAYSGFRITRKGLLKRLEAA